MKNVTKLTVSAIALCGGAFVAAPAMAQEGPTISGNVAMVTDYRFRGVSLSDEDPAIQGGIDLGWDSGFYLGTWGSSIEQYGGSEMEFDLYAGFGGEAGAIGWDIGAIMYAYPGADFDDYAYGEVYASIGGSAGIASWTLGGAYAWDQDSIGGDDNTYVYLSGEVPFGDGPVYGFGHVGWEDGAFGDDKIDYAAGIGASAMGLDFSVSYVDADNGVDGAVVGSIGSSW